MKSGKNVCGIKANSRQTPPVNAKDAYSHLALTFNNSGSSIIRFNANIPNKGMVNSAMTSMDATVRNFAYIGM